MTETPDAEDVTVAPYTRSECCCGDPDCHDFEDRMAAWGIPLDEVKTVTFTKKLN
jgi:hypothetical protein